MFGLFPNQLILIVNRYCRIFHASIIRVALKEGRATNWPCDMSKALEVQEIQIIFLSPSKEHT